MLSPSTPTVRIRVGLSRSPCCTVGSVIVKDMVDLKLQVPVTEEVEVDEKTLAAIDRGIKDADRGRTVTIDEVRKMIPEWISKFESQKPH